MRFCDKEIQECLLNSGKIKRKINRCNLIINIGENNLQGE